jgi:hypothetical protein
MEPTEITITDTASHRIQIATQLLAARLAGGKGLYDGSMPYDDYMAGMCAELLRFADMMIQVNRDMFGDS